MGAILDHLVNDHGVTVEQAKAALASWDVRPITFRGVQVGETMMQNNEVHFALNPDVRKVLGRKELMASVMSELLEEKKFLVTKLFKRSKEAALVEGLGFTKVKADRLYDYYWMNKGDPIRAITRLKAETL